MRQKVEAASLFSLGPGTTHHFCHALYRSKQSQTPPRLKRKRNRLHLSMREAQRMQWDALRPSLLALGCQHVVKGLVVGAVLLELEQHEDSVFCGRLWGDHVQGR